MQQNPSITELVIYRLKTNPHDHLATIVENTNEAVSHFPGFRSREVFQSIRDNRLLMDYVQWDDLASAKKAAAKFPETPEVAPFGSLIEGAEFFGHFQLVNTHELEAREGQTTELVIYQLKPTYRQRSREFFDLYSQEIIHFGGYRHRDHLQATDTPGVWAERVSWDDPEKALAAATEMENNANLKAAFSWVEEVITMQHLKKIG